MHVRRQHQRFCSSISFGVGYLCKVDVDVGFPTGSFKVLIEKIRYTSLSRAHSSANCKRISESNLSPLAYNRGLKCCRKALPELPRNVPERCCFLRTSSWWGSFPQTLQLQRCRPHGSTGTRGILGAAESLPESTYLRGPGGYADTWAAMAVLLGPQSALMKKTRGQDFKESTLQIIRLTQWIACQKF